MKKDNFYLSDNEIDLGNLIKSIWKEKIIVLSISIICGLFGYVYSVSQTKMYKVEITLRDVAPIVFETYQSYLYTDDPRSKSVSQLHNPHDISQQYNYELKLNLLSDDNLFEFAERNNKINDFKNHLKKENISLRNYFKGKLKLTIDNNINLNKYYLTYTEPLPAENFLNDYFVFTQQKALTILKKTITQKILTKIKLYQNNLKIAEEIDLKNPILHSVIENRGIIDEPQQLFYRGTKALAQEIVFLNNLLNEAENLTLDYNQIVEKVSSPLLISHSNKIFVFIGLVLGLFFSFIIIFLKKILKL